MEICLVQRLHGLECGKFFACPECEKLKTKRFRNNPLNQKVAVKSKMGKFMEK